MNKPNTPTPYTEFFSQLRELKSRSGQSYREISEDSGYTVDALTDAVSDDSLPSEKVMLAIVRSCGGDEREWRTKWKEARLRESRRERAPRHPATKELTALADPASVATPTDLTAALNALWTASGRMSLRQIEISSGGVLRRTTVHDVLTGARTRPEWATVWELVKVFRGRGEQPDKTAWLAAWQKARDWAELESRRPRLAEACRTPVRLCEPVALGVHPGLAEITGIATQTAYIERDVDSAIRAAIVSARERSRFILLVGSEGAGKTRLAYEALRAEAPTFGLISPSGEEDLTVALPPRTVLWLDNIERYLGWASLTPLVVQSLLHGSHALIIMATISRQRYGACMFPHDPDGNDDRQRQWEILNQATKFTVPARLSAAELARAAKAPADPQITAVTQSAGSGLIRALASGPHLARHWANADSYAKALISAAVDAQKVGVVGPIPRNLLRDATACYLPVGDLTRDVPGRFDEALAYATATVPGGLAPLMPVSRRAGEAGTPAYRVAEYLLWLRENTEQRDPHTAAADLPCSVLDQHLAEELAACDFAGRTYRAFEEDLARYAIGVLSRWPHDQDDHLKLVMRTVDDVLPDFRRKLAADSRDSGSRESMAARFIAMCRKVLSERISEPSAETAELVEREAVPYSSDGPTVLRIILGSHLRRLRESHEFTVRQAAEKSGITESKIRRIELGRNAIRETEIINLLGIYDPEPEERERLVALAEQSNRPSWWHRYHDILPEWFRAYVRLEEAAQSIRVYETQFIPGLLQTEEYASGVISLCDFPVEEAQRHVVLRKERQRRFGKGKLNLWAIVDEAALRRPIAGVDVQIAQLSSLRELCETRPNLTLQVIPYGAGGYAAPTGFSILRFSDDYLPDVVYSENLTSALYLDRQAEVERYRIALGRLIGVANGIQQTIQILDQIIRDLRLAERRRDRSSSSPSGILRHPLGGGPTL